MPSLALPSIEILLAFIAASLVVLLIPGPGVLYVVARSTTQGTRAGLVSVLGLSSGAFLHVIAATVGLSAILLTSATAFTIVKYLGASYLIYLGLRTIFSGAGKGGGATALTPVSARRLFADGVIISLFNPKVAIFFLAYLPQFVEPGRGPVLQQIFLLGTLYVVLSLITDGGYAVLAGRIRAWLGRHAGRSRWPRYLNGGTFIGLGVHAAFAQTR